MSGQPDLLDLLATTVAGRPHVSTWLLGHLQRAGHVTETGASRRAKVKKCRCGQAIIVGLSDEVCAWEARVDGVPLSPLGEALARVEGRWTYQLTKGGDRFVLDWRDASKIVFWPAGTKDRCDVLREHRCHSSLLAVELTRPTSFSEAAPSLPSGSQPPF